jgi:hypothetical protein
MKTYLVVGTRYGGEHTIGTISKEISEYWEEQDDFEEYIYETYDRNEDGTIPEKYQLSSWYECDDVMHEYSLEYSDQNRINILDIEKDEYIVENLDVTTLKINRTICLEQEHKDANPDFDGSYVYGQHFEKAGWDYEMETDKHFDITKLKVNVSEWSDLQLVNSLVYDDGDAIQGDNEDGSVSKSFSAWIG